MGVKVGVKIGTITLLSDRSEIGFQQLESEKIEERWVAGVFN